MILMPCNHLIIDGGSRSAVGGYLRHNVLDLLHRLVHVLLRADSGELPAEEVSVG